MSFLIEPHVQYEEVHVLSLLVFQVLDSNAFCALLIKYILIKLQAFCSSNIYLSRTTGVAVDP